jgi:hypothetical protein
VLAGAVALVAVCLALLPRVPAPGKAAPEASGRLQMHVLNVFGFSWFSFHFSTLNRKYAGTKVYFPYGKHTVYGNR